MSDDTLRRAVEELRRDVEDLAPTPWHAHAGEVDDLHFGPMSAVMLDSADGNMFAVSGSGMSIADARHMALMNPDVRTALANWLSFAADTCEVMKVPPNPAALAVARAVLKER